MWHRTITKTVAAAMATTDVALPAFIIGLFAWLRSGIAGVRAEMHEIGRRLEDRRMAVEKEQAHLSGLLKGLGRAARVRAELPDSKPPAGVRMYGYSDTPRLDGGMPGADAAAPAPGRTIDVSSRA